MMNGLDSSPPIPTLTLEPGTRLDRYELLCLLAQGGMANVWLARMETRAGFRKLFAVKTILSHVAHDPSFKTMFLDEAGIASRIAHPNVVRMVDVGEFAGIPYLVMDLIEGEPLFRLPKACERLGRRLPLGVVLRILADASHGLHAAHELRNDAGALLNVVHRDMSPQNILVSSAGLSMVIDFGVAKAADRAAQQTSTGTLKGKISYMPKEQACGLAVDRRTDTWALGAVLYYLLAGRPPYKEESQLATLQLAMSGAPVPSLPDAMPASLRAVVMKALSIDPAERFQTAAELGEAIEVLMRRLGLSTTHSEVGLFMTQVMSERFDARRQLIQTALSEAQNRESARTLLANPAPRERGEEQSSLNESVIAFPSGPLPSSHMMAAQPPSFPVPLPEPTGTGPRYIRPNPEGPPETSHAGTFVAFADQGRPLPARPTVRWPTFAVAGAVGLAGVALIIAALVSPQKGKAVHAVPLDPSGALALKAAAAPEGTAATASAGPVAPPVPPPVVEPASPPASSPPVVLADPVPPPKPPPPPPPVVVATAPPPATTAAPSPPPRPPPPVARPARPSNTGSTTKKKRDDEAGF
jgi:serine/threonine protein kinase